MPSPIPMVAPASDKSRHGRCAVATLSKEKSGRGRSFGSGGMMVLKAARLQLRRCACVEEKFKLRVDFNR